jgi:hypothetical protein
VTGGDPAEVGVVERVEQVHRLVAGKAEHDLDALPSELLDGGLAARPSTGDEQAWAVASPEPAL